jgi:hypothetical protein
MRTILCMLLCAGLLHTSVFGQVLLDAEAGMISAGYNDVRIPGAGGTDLSFTDELSTEPAFFYRLRVGYTLDGSHTFVALFAPLTLMAYGTPERSISFFGTQFPSGTRLTGTYIFNSYRLILIQLKDVLML